MFRNASTCFSSSLVGGTQLDLGGLLFELPGPPFVALAVANLEVSAGSALGREVEGELVSPSAATESLREGS